MADDPLDRLNLSRLDHNAAQAWFRAEARDETYDYDNADDRAELKARLRRLVREGKAWARDLLNDL